MCFDGDQLRQSLTCFRAKTFYKTVGSNTQRNYIISVMKYSNMSVSKQPSWSKQNTWMIIKTFFKNCFCISRTCFLVLEMLCLLHLLHVRQLDNDQHKLRRVVTTQHCTQTQLINILSSKVWWANVQREKKCSDC